MGYNRGLKLETKSTRPLIYRQSNMAKKKATAKKATTKKATTKKATKKAATKKKAAAKKKVADGDEAAPKKKKKRKSRKKAEEVIRRKVYWGVFNHAMKLIAKYEFNQRKAADKRAGELSPEGKPPHFVQKIKEDIVEVIEPAAEEETTATKKKAAKKKAAKKTTAKKTTAKKAAKKKAKKKA